MTHDDGQTPPVPDDDSERQTVVVASAMPLSLRTRPVEHPSIPEGAVGLGTYIEDRLLGRQAMKEETIPAYVTLLSVPRRLAYVAYDKEDGAVEGQLAALVKPSEIAALGGRPEGHEPGESEEPWKESVPSYESPEGDIPDPSASSSDDDHVALLPLGLVVRMSQRRVHPDDLAAEAADVLRTVVNEGSVEIVDQFLDTI
ncbi:MAG: hypothetical protein PVI57_01655 [Gemmatimonadota bacterium]|jgi:hypothetical protein